MTKKPVRGLTALCSRGGAKLWQKATPLLRLLTIHRTAAWRRGSIITQPRVESRGRILSVRTVPASNVCAKRGKDQSYCCMCISRKAKKTKTSRMFAGSGVFDQAFSKLQMQIDAKQSAISFRQEDRQTSWSSGRDSRPQVENSAATTLTLDMWYRKDNVGSQG